MKLSTVSCQFLSTLQLVFALNFHAVTEEIGLGDTVGRIAAFADFNADKVTDVLVLNATGSDHTILLWSSKGQRFVHNPISLDVPMPIEEVRTGDFDGDGTVDILTLHNVRFSSDVETGGSKCYTAIVHWCMVGEGSVTVQCHKSSSSLLPNVSSPLVLDINGDHIPDLFAVTCDETNAQPTFFISTPSDDSSFTFTSLLLDSPPVHDLLGSCFVDLDSDCLPELVLFRSIDSIVEVWKRNEISGMERVFNQSLNSILKPYVNVVLTSIPAFADMDGDGVFETVVFSCYDPKCNQTAVHVLQQKREPGVDIIKCQPSSSWKLNFTDVVTVNLTGVSFDPSNLIATQPIVGDLDLDGFPDVITTVPNRNSESGTIKTQHPLVLLGSAGGRLRPQLDLFNEAAVANVTQVAYFDLWEDGVLDVMMAQDSVFRGDETIPPAGGKLLAYRQSLSQDHTFLKVLVLSGHCYSNCKSGHKPYGSVLPGATVSFSTTGRSGRNERSVAMIHYSGSNSLQLPFALFGLGETPNFIEDLTVGAGYSVGDGMKNGNATLNLGIHQWSLLVPNSQVIVSLFPIDDASKWHIELYLTPSHLVYSTAGVLCALAVGIAVIIGLLQAREKYQDSKEKKQAKHRFHFNAM